MVARDDTRTGIETGPEAERARSLRALSRARGVVGLAAAQVRHTPVRTALSVLGIALAVLAVTLLASTGFGVLETGQERFAAADRDLWITGGSVEVTPQGGLENPIVGAHEISASLEARDDVETAAPLAFHGVYVEHGDDRELVTAVGLPGTHAGLDLEAGEPLEGGDLHYADGGYDGPRTDELIVDRSTADALGLEVGDDVVVSSSADGGGRAVTVVGISSTYSQFLGTPTVTMPLSELQALAGTTESDRATFVTVALADGADAAAAQAAIQEEHPEYEVRSNEEQFERMLESHVLVMASAVTLVVLAVLVGSALALNVLVLSVVQQSREFVALQLLGVSRWTLTGVVLVQGLVLGALGGLVGLAATPVLAAGVNEAAVRLTGFPDLLRVTADVYALGGAVAAVICLFGSVAVGAYLASRLGATSRLLE
ncbi:ABC transporter permease [Natrononativus amylolyticus]|uniref:ABC transporter permease n=1 Tax=Natrononativus amylolyticus TaxID=2963434 RepID=UPI0020CD46D8|nr:ABC transporter permease [Natrononativus amylolyticus]